jgi:hypothetical protein
MAKLKLTSNWRRFRAAPVIVEKLDDPQSMWLKIEALNGDYTASASV